jgi:hypothetical protein
MRRVVGMAWVVSAVAGRAYAQSSDTSATAEQLFDQGRELVKANKWAEACPKFEASLRYDLALGTRLNLATCYEHASTLLSAWGPRDWRPQASDSCSARRRDRPSVMRRRSAVRA